MYREKRAQRHTHLQHKSLSCQSKWKLHRTDGYISVTHSLTPRICFYLYQFCSTKNVFRSLCLVFFFGFVVIILQTLFHDVYFTDFFLVGFVWPHSFTRSFANNSHFRVLYWGYTENESVREKEATKPFTPTNQRTVREIIIHTEIKLNARV